MSYIVNYPADYIMHSQDYTDYTASDIYNRFKVQEAELPCIFNGFAVTAGTGLNANVSAGSAQGLDIPFTIDNVSNQMRPTNINNTSGGFTVACDDDSTGYIVLNLNIWGINQGSGILVPGSTSNANLYAVDMTDSADLPPTSNIAPVYVTELQSGVGTSYPYTQIVLAKVTTSGGAITNIDTSYDPDPTLTSRSFDYSNICTGDITQGAISYPGGVFEKFGNVSVPADSVVTVTFKTPFPNQALTAQISQGIGTPVNSGISIEALSTSEITIDYGASSGDPVNVFWNVKGR